MVCSNMSGSEKLPLLDIGKSWEHIKTLPTSYEAANKKQVDSIRALHGMVKETWSTIPQQGKKSRRESGQLPNPL